MSTRRWLGHSLAFAMVLSVTGSAFARRPPALVQAEIDSDRALCQSDAVRSGAGYRDMTARFGDDAAGVRSSASYRDMVARLNVEAPLAHVACDTLGVPRLSASR